jgi:hypothetical protein
VDDSFEELAVLREVDHGQVCQCHTHDDGGDQAGIVPERIAECSGAHHYGHDRLGGHRTAEAQLVQVVPSHEPGRQQQDDGGKPDSAGHDLTGRGEKDGHTEPDENVPPPDCSVWWGSKSGLHPDVFGVGPISAYPYFHAPEPECTK